MNGVAVVAYQVLAGALLFFAPSLLVYLKWSWTLFRKGSVPLGSTSWFQWLPLLGDGLQFYRTPEKFWDTQLARYVGGGWLACLVARSLACLPGCLQLCGLECVGLPAAVF